MTFDTDTLHEILMHEHLVGLAEGIFIGSALVVCVVMAVVAKALEEVA